MFSIENTIASAILRSATVTPPPLTGGGWGEGEHSFQTLHSNRLQHPIQIIQNMMIPKSEHLEPIIGQTTISLFVFRSVD